MKNSDVASCHGVKGRLAKNIKFWEKIGVNNFVLETLRKGYVIPFLENPVKMFKKNNRSAMKNAEFVDQAVHRRLTPSVAGTKRRPILTFIITRVIRIRSCFQCDRLC
jgi:hypothetical protein